MKKKILLQFEKSRLLVLFSNYIQGTCKRRARIDIIFLLQYYAPDQSTFSFVLLRLHIRRNVILKITMFFILKNGNNQPKALLRLVHAHLKMFKVGSVVCNSCSSKKTWPSIQSKSEAYKKRTVYKFYRGPRVGWRGSKGGVFVIAAVSPLASVSSETAWKPLHPDGHQVSGRTSLTNSAKAITVASFRPKLQVDTLLLFKSSFATNQGPSWFFFLNGLNILFHFSVCSNP